MEGCWKMPGAVIVEGPKAGGHQGAKYERTIRS